MNIAIIGGGASGLVCSILLKKFNHLLNIDLYEKNNKLGKKILATGNGKCNIMNDDIHSSYYNNQEIINHLTSRVSNKLVKEILDELGIFLYSDNEGRCYPLSNSSQNIMQILETQVYIHKVNGILNTLVSKISYDGFYHINDYNKSYDYLIICSGSNASFAKDLHAPYHYLKNFDINLTPLRPSLVGIKTPLFQKISGVRVKVKASLFENENLIDTECGELIFKDDGVSGICIMNLSANITSNPSNYFLKIDLIPYLTEQQINELIKRQVDNDYKKRTLNFLYGLFNKKLADHINSKNEYKALLSDNSGNEFINSFKYISFQCEGIYGIEQSQVISGGIDLSQLDDYEFKKHKKMYACGEALDVDGKCGGYNLFFAIASAIYVANKIIGEINETTN